MPIWTTDYLSSPSVQAMDGAESGGYLHLLMAQWDRDDDRLPNDEALLRRIAKWRPEFDSIGCQFGKVLDCFVLRASWIWNAKLREIKRQGQEYRAEVSGKRRDAAAIRWEQERQMQMQCMSNANADANAMQREKENSRKGISLSAGVGEEGEESARGAGASLLTADDAPGWLLNLSTAHQRRLVAAAAAKSRDLVELALECDEYWIRKDAIKPPMYGPRWYSRLGNWIAQAHDRSPQQAPRVRAFQPANTDPRRPVVEVDEP